MSYSLKILLYHLSSLPYIDLGSYIQGHVAVAWIYYFWMETLDTKSL